MIKIPTKLPGMNTGEGQLIAGRYLLRKELGRGGMAIIYVGMDTVLKREVAIKILYPHFTSDSTLIQRFINEARIIAKLHYKSIVSLYDIAQHDGVPFIVLEYVQGYDLRHMQDTLVKERKKISPEAALIMAYIVCDAVAHAHSLGIVHRDIKPENVLISSLGEMKITDFGLAHILTDTRITMSGAAIGSPEFMSPEHINSNNIGSASDVFSLGSLLYWLITGISPFYADNTMSILNNISRNSYRPIRASAPGIDDWIEKTVATCLSPRPENRYRDASELAGVLYDGIEKFSPDPYAAFRLYINSPGQTENALLQQHNAVRHAEATAHIKSNNFEKALSVISTMLETGDEQTDTTGLMKALKKRRYSRWIVTGLELAVLFLAVLMIAKEEYRETPAGFSARPQTLAQPVLPKETSPAHKPATVSRKKVVRQVLTVYPVRRQNNRMNNVPAQNPDAASNPQQQAAYTGTLELITYPWAMVFIDDKYIGETPRLKNITLSAGEHKMYLMNPYLKPYTVTLTILPDKTITKRIELNEPSP